MAARTAGSRQHQQRAQPKQPKHKALKEATRVGRRELITKQVTKRGSKVAFKL